MAVRRIWTEEEDALIDTMPDSELAVKLGVTGHTVRSRRVKLGKPNRWTQAREWTAEEDALLGKMPDRAVGEIVGVSTATACTRRTSLEIPAFRSSGLLEPTEVDLSNVEPENFPVESDNCWWRVCPTCRAALSYVMQSSAVKAERQETSCINCSRSTARRAKRPEMYRGIRTAWVTHFRAGARNRNLCFDITNDDIADVYERQGGKCALSGTPIPFNESGDSKFCTKASIDRIDSSKGYTADNIQIVHSFVNTMKMDASQEEFIAMCRAVAATHPE